MAFLDFLETLTGIKGLIPDPHFMGGALHQILPGGKLAIHSDFNNRSAPRTTPPNQRLALFKRGLETFLWWGFGALGYLDEALCAAYLTNFESMCDFNTTSDSFHGHPDSVMCPKGQSRNSIALYYYTRASDRMLMQSHSTLWQARPGIDEPSGEGNDERGKLAKLRTSLKRRIKPWVPTVLREL